MHGAPPADDTTPRGDTLRWYDSIGRTLPKSKERNPLGSSELGRSAFRYVLLSWAGLRSVVFYWVGLGQGPRPP